MMHHRRRRILLPLVVPVLILLTFFYGAPALAGKGAETDFASPLTSDEPALASPLQQLTSITISTDTTWYSASVTVDSLVITGSAKLALARPNGHTGTITITANAITIAEGSHISLDGTGHAADAGPGAAGHVGGGAGHGGYGGGGGALDEPEKNRRGGNGYDNPYEPAMLGSGGRSVGVSGGGAGGGAVHFFVTDTLNVEGALSANGLPGTNNNVQASGGGSGGAIWIETGALVGNGSIVANGGPGGTSNFNVDGGSGSGGRIAIYAGEDLFSIYAGGSGTIKAVGAAAPDSNPLPFHQGGPGTIILQEAQGALELLVDNEYDDADYHGYTHYATLPESEYAFDTIYLEHNGHLEIKGTSSILTITNDTILGDGTANLAVNGQIIAPQHFVFDQALLEIRGELVGPEFITTTQSGGIQFSITTPLHTGFYTYTNITVGNGTSLIFASLATTTTNYADDRIPTLVVTNLTIAPGGILSTDARGYPSGFGPGRASPATSKAGGGGHGGSGGNGRSGSGTLGIGYGGNAYCDWFAPTTAGSGGAYGTNSLGGAGAGGIHLIVSNELLLNGTVSAQGETAPPRNGFNTGGGGGAGGAVWIETATLTGTGSIFAEGGDGAAAYLSGEGGGGGGGGCIAIFAGTDNSTLELSVVGGSEYSNDSDVTAGEIGTIFRNTIQPVSSTVDIAPATITANGMATATVTISVVNVDNLPVPSAAVALAVAPTTGMSIDGAPIASSLVLIGTTNNSGTITATLSATSAGVKTLTAFANDIPLADTPTITFTAGAVNVTASDFLLVGPANAPADGTTPLMVQLTARDAFGNPVVGANPVITATGSATVTLNGTTDSDGEVTGGITDDTIETITLTASLNGQPLPDVLTATFRGPDVTVSKTAAALSNGGPSSTHALSGFKITYTLDIENSGLLDAEGVVVTDTLPVSLTFLTQTSPYTFNQDGSDLVWTVEDLEAEASGEIVVIAQIDTALTGAITNTVEISAAIDDTPANNQTTLTTIVEEPLPQLLASPAAPTLIVAPDDSTERVVTIHNIGVAPLTDFVITLPPTLTWVTVDTSGLPSSLPVTASTHFTVTASPPATQVLGYYHDYLSVTAAGGWEDLVALTVQVRHPERPLSISVTNDIGHPVPNASVQLVQTEGSAIVQEGGTVQTYNETYSLLTDATGTASLTAIQSGTYTYTLNAVNHTVANGVVVVPSGSTTHTLIFTPTAKPALAYSPEVPALPVIRGTTQAKSIELTNLGAAPLTGLTVTLAASPAPPNWLALGLPLTVPVLAPGESFSFNVLASPPLSETEGIYQQYVHIEGNGIPNQNIPLEVSVTSGLTRTVEVEVQDTRQRTVTEGSVLLVDHYQTPVQTPDGIRWINRYFTAEIDNTGTALFEALPISTYNLKAEAPGFFRKTAVLVVEPDTEPQAPLAFVPYRDVPSTAQKVHFSPGAYRSRALLPAPQDPDTKPNFVPAPLLSGAPQEVPVILRGNPFIYTWDVDPLTDTYGITFTLDYETDNGPPTVWVYPRMWGFNSCRLTIADELTIYNPTDVPLNMTGLTVTIPGIDVIVPPVSGAIASHAEMTVPVTATVHTPAAMEYGLVSAGFTYSEVAPLDFDVNQFVGVNLHPGEIYTDVEVLELTVGNAETTEVSLAGSGPNWISVGLTAGGTTGEWNTSLSVNTPEFLAEGIYHAEYVITAIDDDPEHYEPRTRTGVLGVTVTRTADVITLSSTFTLDFPATYSEADQSSGIIGNSYESECDEEGGGGGDPWPGGGSGGGGGGGGGTGNGGGSTTGPDYFPPFPDYLPPPFGNGRQEARLQLSQHASLIGEGFLARLQLTNTGEFPLVNTEIDLTVKDLTGTVRSEDFYILPSETATLGTLALEADATATWTIIPRDTVTVPVEGEPFLIEPTVYYSADGIPYSDTDIMPGVIQVYPAPDLSFTYRLPLPDYACTIFDLNLIVVNQGEGPARNLRLQSLAPQISAVDGSGRVLNFNITDVWVNDEPVSPNSTQIDLGSLAPDPEAQSIVRWRIQASEPGRFVSFTANLQHNNPQGLPLRPLISEVRSEFVRPTDENYGGCVRTELANPQTWVKGECPFCGNEELQDYVGDPINTRSGNFSHHSTDLSVPTARGALRLERSYNSQATTGTYPYSATFGYGWSHNYEIRLWAEPRDTGQHPIIPTITDTLRLANRIFLQAPHGSQLPFFRNYDEAGNAIFPDQYFGGGAVRSWLVRDENGEYDVSTARQELYHFNAQGQLEYRRDPQGNETHYTYAGGRLYRVTEDISDRYLQFEYDEATGLLTSVSDHSGRTVSYGYAGDDLAVFTDTRNFTWTYGYTDTHLLETVSDHLGQPVLQTFYDEEDRAYRQLDALGNIVTEVDYTSDDHRTVTENGVVRVSTYDGTGTLVQQVVDNQPQSFTFDAYLNRDSVTDGDGNKTRFARTDMGLTTAITDALTNTTRFTYDEQNRLTLTVDAQNRETRYEYDELSNLRVLTDALGNRTVYTYNAVGQLLEEEDALERVTTYVYDALGQLESVTDALTNTTLYEYDTLGRVITSTDALGKVSINGYDAAGNVVSVTENYTTTTDTQNYLNTYNLVTGYTYDAFNRRTEIVDTLGRVTRWEYNVAGWLMQVTENYSVTPGLPENEYNLISTYGYDEVGRQVLITDTLGHVAFTGYTDAGQVECSIRNYVVAGEDEGCDVEHDPDFPDRNIVTRYGYDLNGRPVSTWDTLGRETHTVYDALGRVEQTILNYVDGVYNPEEPDRDIATLYGYDATGNQTSVTDVLGRVHRTSYDALNRPVVTIQNYVSPTIPGATDINITTIYTYNEVGNRVAAEDPKGRVTTYEYDALNRLITVTNALTGVTVYGYDTVGNQVSVQDALGRVTLTTYDSLYRPAMVVQNFISGTGSTSDTNVTTLYTYDALGNRTTVTDPLGRVMAYAYDSLNRLLVSTMNPSTTVASDLNVTTTYTYDAAGRRLRVEDSYGRPTVHTYDDLGRVISTANALSHTTTFVYNGPGNRLQTTNGENENTVFTYDELNRLLTRTTDETRTTTYTYNGAGNRTAMSDGNGVVTCYGFDGLDRLESVTENCLEVTVNPYEDNLVTQYQYDQVGNRLAVVNARGYTTTYTYDPLNRLVSEADPLTHTTMFAYDALGNRTVLTDATLQTTTFAYDDLNRLEVINYPAGTADVTFDYDAMGNRLIMIDGTGTTTYTYDLLNRLVESRDGADQLVTYDYDKMGNRMELASDSHIVSYAYDDAHRLQTVTNGSDGDFGYFYDDAGRLTELHYPNGVTTQYVYDDDGHLVELTHSTTDTLLSRYEYVVDPVGNRDLITETLRVPYYGGGAFGLTDGMSAEPPASSEASDTPLDGAADAPDAWQDGVQPAIELSEYEISWTDQTPWPEVPGAYLAPNARHRLRAYFADREVRLVRDSENTPAWFVGFELSQIGYGTATIPLSVTTATATGNRMEYQRALPNGGAVVEWYVNGAEGIEQGFTFSAAPGEAAPGEMLVVGLAFTGVNTIADVVQEGSTFEFRSAGGVVLFRYSGLHVYDASGQTLPATLVPVQLEGRVVGVRLEIVDSGAVYPITIDPLLNLPAWAATSPTADDSARYGHSVSSAGDVNGDGYADLLVGAPDHDIGVNSQVGAVFLYLGGADGLTTTAALTLTGEGAGDHFGTSLAVIGDINGDGDSDVLVGAPGYDVPKTGVGKAYVYASNGSGSLSTTPLWTWTEDQGGDSAGASVAALGDVNGDSRPDIAIGAPLDNGKGRVAVFYGTSASPYFPATPSWSGAGPGAGQTGARLGQTVAAAGDVDGDMYADLLVGAPFWDDSQSDEGVVFVWYGSSTGFGSGTTPDWSNQQNQANAHYGASLSGAGDVNSDGYDDLIIGMPNYDGGGSLTDAGQALVFEGDSGGLAGSAAWSVTGTTTSEQVGLAVAGVGDVNGDWYGDVVTGANNRARAYHGASGGLLTAAAWEEDYSTYGAYAYGYAVAGVGDVNGDTFRDVAVGAPQEYTFLSAPGYAYVYHGGDDQITITSLINDSPTVVDQATTFTLTLSSGTNVTYTWNFGDGSAPLAGGNVITHVYTAVGGYTAVVTASNSVAVVTATTPVSIQAGFITLTRVIDYDYDPLYRLTGAEYSTGGAYAYEYDEVGNRLTQTIGAGSPIGYSYDEANRLTNVGGVVYTWDDNGNLLDDGTYEYSYDASNRLVEVRVADIMPAEVVSSYLYDGIGNRVGLTDSNGITAFVLDITGGLPEVIAATVGTDTTHYLQVRGQVLAQTDSENWQYVLPDYLGTVRQVTDEVGEVMGYADHDPFGVSAIDEESSGSAFGYTGEWVEENEQIFLRARYYLPLNGRFNQADVFAGHFLRPQTQNRYAYVSNDPINYFDPSGFQGEPAIPTLEDWVRSNGLPNEYNIQSMQTLVGLKEHVVAAAQRHGFMPVRICAATPEERQVLYALAAILYRESIGAYQEGQLDPFVASIYPWGYVLAPLAELQGNVVGRPYSQSDLDVFRSGDPTIGLGQLRPSTAYQLEQSEYILQVGDWDNPNREPTKYFPPRHPRARRSEVLRLLHPLWAVEYVAANMQYARTQQNFFANHKHPTQDRFMDEWEKMATYHNRGVIDTASALISAPDPVKLMSDLNSYLVGTSTAIEAIMRLDILDIQKSCEVGC